MFSLSELNSNNGIQHAYFALGFFFFFKKCRDPFPACPVFPARAHSSLLFEGFCRQKSTRLLRGCRWGDGLECWYVSLHLWSVGFPGGSVVKNLPANPRGAGLIAGWGRSPGEGNGNPLQSSCLENRTDRGAWRATVREVAKSQAWLSD